MSSSSIKKLKKYAGSVNIAHDLDEEQLRAIGDRVLRGYQEDKNSMSEWLSDVDEIEELASLKCVKKSTPLPNSSNVKLPIITNACIQFSSRTYPAIFKDRQLVKAAIIGDDDPQYNKAKQGKRIADYMNYQLLFQYQDWEIEQDRLLFLLPLIGFICKKTYYDPIKGKNISRLCDYKKIIINADTPSLKDAVRVTEVISLKLNDVMARKNKKIDDQSVFLESCVDALYELHKLDDLNKDIEFLEQQVDLDLDEDGISEPYIVTVLKENGEVFRIVPRFHEKGIMEEDDKVICIYPIDIYVDYHFLPSPKGKFQSVGFGVLLLHLNQAINSVLNQLIDAGQLANMKAGYMDARLKVLPSTDSRHDQGEFKLVKALPGVALKDGIVPLQYGEPSNVLFSLLGLLIQHSEQLSSSTDLQNGTQNSQNAKTGATLALMQQGRATFDSIQKRVYRSLSQEFRQLFKLNGTYLNESEFAEYEGGAVRVTKDDFDEKNVRIVPVADPNLASDTERLANAAFVQSIALAPGIDPVKATRFILAQTNIPNIESILSDPKEQKPPSPEILQIQADMEKSAQELNIEGERLQQNEKEIQIKSAVAQADIVLKKAQAVALLAKAESEDAKLSLEHYKTQLDAISQTLEHSMRASEMEHERAMMDLEQQNEMQLMQQEQQQPSTPTGE